MGQQRGATVAEVLVAMAIVATMLCLLTPALWRAMSTAEQRNQTSQAAAEGGRVLSAAWYMQTVMHDGHWWVQNIEARHFVHHPDCPCRTPRLRIPTPAEQEGGE
jgi:hypothetical protein